MWFCEISAAPESHLDQTVWNLKQQGNKKLKISPEVT